MLRRTAVSIKKSSKVKCVKSMLFWSIVKKSPQTKNHATKNWHRHKIEIEITLSTRTDFLYSRGSFLFSLSSSIFNEVLQNYLLKMIEKYNGTDKTHSMRKIGRLDGR